MKTGTEKISFASENYDGVHPAIMEALIAANKGFAPSYGNDELTKDTRELIQSIFGAETEAYFTFNGTGANNFGLACITANYNSIYCSDVAHLYVDESTAPESFLGCRLFVVPTVDGKVTADGLRNSVKRRGDVHHPQPGVVTLTQPTEYGTVYTKEELQAIKEICVANDLLLHVDGARFFNATVHLNAGLKEISADAGIDVLTLGGTKTGLMFGEAVLFFNPKDCESLKYQLKRSMQLSSKHRFITAQFQRLLSDDLWKDIANYTNNLAKLFEQEIADIPSVSVAYPVETNAVFLNLSMELYDKLKDHANFYYWNELKEEARLIFSYGNTESEVREFVEILKGCAS